MIDTRIVQTWLSRPPREGAVLFSIVSVAFVALVSNLAWNDVWGLRDKLPVSGESIFVQQEYWRLWTAVLVHGDGGHLLSNSLFLLIFGALIYGTFSPLVYPVLAVFFGGLINLVTLTFMEPQTRLIGASGVVYWLGGVWLILYLTIHRVRPLSARLLRSLGVAFALFMPTEAFNPSVSYPAHAIGFFFGAVFGLVYFLLYKTRFRAAEVVQIVIDGPTSTEEESLPAHPDPRND